MKRLALITGASSGIGRELARVHASQGGDVILVGRRRDALERLKSELEEAHGVAAHVIVADLSMESGPDRVITAVREAGLRVEVLINCAGLGGQGAHVDRPLADDLRMIDVNVRALVVLTHHFASEMAASGGGRILNVSSAAALIPGPYQAVYYATKAFVTSFSNAIDEEMRPRGVTCTVLMPGIVDTGFQSVAGLEGTGVARLPGPSAAVVARRGYKALQAGKLSVIPQMPLAFLLNWITPLAPRRLTMRVVAALQKR